MKTLVPYAVVALALSSLSEKAHSISDTDCMALTVYKEARGEPVAGRRAVLDVVKNRMRIREKNACQIMLEKRQFSFVTPKMSTKVPMEAMLDYLEVSEMPSVVPEETEFYHATYVNPKWKRVRKVTKIGQHIFYARRM